MRGGKLRHRIEIQAATTATNSLNEKTESWATADTVYAEIIPGTSKEASFARSFIGSSSHLIRIRYYEGLTNKHRVKFGSRVFSIDGVQQVDEIKREMLLTCTERANVVTY